MDLQTRLEALVTPTLEGMGYELVRVQYQGTVRPTLQIMAERQDGKDMTVDDCADISRALSAVLDVEDPIPAAYTLEVSSPGIDRPLVRRKDFERYAGFDVKLDAKQPIDGRKRFRGRLLGIGEDDLIRLEIESGEVAIPFADLHRAKLVLTDELIAATLKDQEQ
ncbi:ribosome maturation factor RimP [Telmatospirillum sp. J64-1]|uniref:ribosome maturation factor RimP n=1 Tax=Telmatospirillum sp. J64-1 TaxID=2502183 RepID=UPI00115E02FC|nr:ribosome maturation factor RimP [Telmatospirillum sp. J64-1]